MEVIKKETIITNPIEGVLHNSMIPYAEYVILDRALPRVEDGLKPVQRRILYSMYENGIFPDKGFRKSATVVGYCLGHYHPHGDTSVYDAMVRLAQPYNMRMTLIEGQGNFGSIDGDPAAAMRYTEVKLQPLALELIKDIDKNTVRWNPNFDDSIKEPDILPGRYPNLLVNGSTGIAVGLATNIPPHNLAEVIDGAIAYINNPKITLDEMMKIVRGPDFPTGGYIIATNELKKAYETGRGKISIRAKIIVENEGDKKSLVITELPYQTNKAQLLKKIDDLCEEKKDIFKDIQSVHDESDRKGMRAVIRLKKDADIDTLIKNLFKYTGLESSFGINMVAIANGKPVQLSLLEYYKIYVEYQRNIILKRTKFDLDRAKERAHILEGLIIAVTNIDEVIKIIRNAADTATARLGLRKAFNLTERQANAILDLRLARLNKLEVENLKAELSSLKNLIKEYTLIVESKSRQMEVVINEMAQIKKKYRDDRRSIIVSDSEQVTVSSLTAKVNNEKYFIGYNAIGKIRKLNIDSFKRISNENEPVCKDIFKFSTEVKNDEFVYAFTNKGNCFKIDIELLPESKGTFLQGVDFANLFKEADKGEKPVKFYAVKGVEVPKGKLIFFTKQGAVKLTDWSEYTVQKGYYQAIKLKDDDEVLSIEQEKDNTTMFFVTKQGMCLNAEKDKLPEQGRVAGGVKGIDLYDGDEVVLAKLIDDSNSFALIGGTNGLFKKVDLSTISRLSRARKGVKLFDINGGKFTETLLIADVILKDENKGIYLVDRMGIEYYSDTNAVLIENRTSKGKPIKSIGVCPMDTAFVYKKRNS